MSNDMLQDDELDAVAGGTGVVPSTKVANTAYLAAVQANRGAPSPTPTNHTIDRQAGTAGLERLRKTRP